MANAAHSLYLTRPQLRLSVRPASRSEMELTIPYTFYPVALPHWIAWSLVTLAILGGVAVGLSQRSRYGWLRGVGAAVVGTVGCLVVTVVASMVITYFVHDQ